MLAGFFTDFFDQLFQAGTGKLHMSGLDGPAVVDGFRTESHAHGLLHLFAQPQDAVHIIAVLDTEFIDLDQEIFQGDQTDKAGIIIVVLAGAPDGTIVEEVGRLAAQSAQGAFKPGETGLRAARIDEEATRFVSWRWSRCPSGLGMASRIMEQ